MVNERAVRILLECILVFVCVCVCEGVTGMQCGGTVGHKRGVDEHHRGTTG